MRNQDKPQLRRRGDVTTTVKTVKLTPREEEAWRALGGGTWVRRMLAAHLALIGTTGAAGE